MPAPSAAAPSTLRRTPLFECHVAAGARLLEFAGFQMPAHYAAGGAGAVRLEHMAVRESCGVFDVSHMGEIEVAGDGAEALLQRVLSNDIARMSPGAAQYSVMCGEDGGVLEDLIAYRLAPERYLLVTNAANHERDLRHLQAQAEGFAATVSERGERFAMLAVQGPRARALVGGLAGGELPGRMRAARLEVAGVAALACGTGYTGEDGLELLVAPEHAVALWEALVGAGARAAGLAARDTLRLEACLPLYGNELSVRRGPIEAGLGWCCRERTGFIGADAVRARREAGPAERLVAFALEGPGIPRQGNRVLGGGEVTSGSFSPCLGAGIGLGYVPAAGAVPGTELEIDVRGRIRRATVRAMPFVPKRA